MIDPQDTFGRPITGMANFPGDPMAIPEEIFEDLCEFFAVSPERIKDSKVRVRQALMPRYIIATIMRDQYKFSYCEIDRAMGAKQSATVHRVKMGRKLFREGAELAKAST